MSQPDDLPEATLARHRKLRQNSADNVNAMAQQYRDHERERKRRRQSFEPVKVFLILLLVLIPALLLAFAFVGHPSGAVPVFLLGIFVVAVIFWVLRA
jgi:uncharacterized membrane protein